MKKLFGLVGAFALVFTLAACTSYVEGEESYSYMSVDINPSIEFVVNSEGTVESYNAKNEDAEIVVAALIELDIELEGKDYADATVAFVEAATELGYIDVDREDNVVIIDVASDDEERDNDRVEEALRRANGFFEVHAIAGIAMRGEHQEEIEDIAGEYAVGYGVARIMLSATILDEELTLEAASEMSVGELMLIIREEHTSRRQAFVEERMEQRRAMAHAMQEEARERLEEHRGNIDEIIGSLPDAETLRERMQENRAEARADFEARVALRRQRIQDELEDDSNDSTSDEDGDEDSNSGL